MSDPNAASPPPTEDSAEPGWYVALGQERQGPLRWAELLEMARAGQLGPGQLVWTDGMAQWQPAGSVPGLFVAAVAYAGPVDPHTRRIIRNAKHNAVAMFVLFLLGLLQAVGIATTMGPRTSAADLAHMMVGCLPCVGLVGGIFAAIYLPLRWTLINQLSGGYRMMARVGGFGCIGLLLLCLVMIAVVALSPTGPYGGGAAP